MLLKIPSDHSNGNDNFLATDCLQIFNTGETVGEGREGVAGRHLGRIVAFACPNMCGGNFILISVKILSKILLMAKSIVKT
jgi:hypothetical protein